MTDQSVEVRSPGGTYSEIPAVSYEVTLGTHQTHLVPTAQVTTTGTATVSEGDNLRVRTPAQTVFEGGVRSVTYDQQGAKRLKCKHPATDLFAESVTLPKQFAEASQHIQNALTVSSAGGSYTFTAPTTSQFTYSADPKRGLRQILRDICDEAGLVLIVNPVAKTLTFEELGSGGLWRSVDTGAGDGTITKWSPGDIDTVRNAVTVIGTGGLATQAVAEDSQSINTYGRRTGDSPYKYRGISTQAAAQAAANSLLRPEPLPSGEVTLPESGGEIYQPRVNQTLQLSDELRELSGAVVTVTKQRIQPGRAELSVGGGGEAYSTDETARRQTSTDDTTSPGSVYGSDRIADEAIDTAQLAPGAVASDKVQDLAIDTAQIKANAIANGKLESGSVGTDTIQDLAVASDKISGAAVTTNKLGDLSVSSTKIEDDAITTPKVTAEAVEASLIASDAIISRTIAAEAVSTNELAANAITADEIEAAAVDTTALSTDAVIASKISAGSVGADEIAANSITANQIDVLNLDAGELSVADSGGNSIEIDIEPRSLAPDRFAIFPQINDSTFSLAQLGKGNTGNYFDTGFIRQLLPESGEFSSVGSSSARYANAYFEDMDIEPQNTAGNGIDITTASGAIAFDEQAILPKTDGFGILGSGNGTSSDKAWKEIHTNNLYQYSPEPLDAADVDLDELRRSSWRDPPRYASQAEAADGTYTTLPERGSETGSSDSSGTATETTAAEPESGRGVELGHMTNYLRAALSAEVERRRELQETVKELRDRLNHVESELGV